MAAMMMSEKKKMEVLQLPKSPWTEWTWQQWTSFYFRSILMSVYVPMKFFGFLVEWTTNFVVHNGGLLGLFSKLFLFWNWGTHMNEWSSHCSVFELSVSLKCNL